MARHSIGLFGALFAVGSVLAWKYVQSKDVSGRRVMRDITRWEDEGGKVLTPVGSRSAPVNGNDVVGGTADAWHFPRS
jgi:hypothetical protein